MTDEKPLFVAVAGIGDVAFPSEFVAFTGGLSSAETRDATGSARAILEELASGAAVVLTGPYRYIDAVYRYCQKFERDLVSPHEIGKFDHPRDKRAAYTEARRRKLHRLLMRMQGDAPLDATDPPNTDGLTEWFENPVADAPYLMPVRRLQRILTDMERARSGVRIDGLPETLLILPHVYVPSDQSVPAMVREYATLIDGRSVLDVGTGTGVLAVLAASLGARRVVAVDANPRAVENARLNTERCGFRDVIDVKPPGDLFEPVQGETFDAILFNAPWFDKEIESRYDLARYDPGFRVLRTFLAEASAHLSSDGAILLQHSSLARDGIALIESDPSVEVASSRSIERRSRSFGGRERVMLYELRPRAARA